MKFNIEQRLQSADIRKFVGLAFIAVSIAGILFFGYEQLWTNHSSHKAARETAVEIKSDWNQNSATKMVPKIGQGFGLLYIPRLKRSVWELPIMEGTDPEQLDVGVGHYPATQLPGQRGNFAIAGHRSTHGEPFAKFDQLEAGDRVIVQTRDKWYTYQLDFDAQVTPDEGWVLEKNPGGMAATVDSDKLITLTTCTPRYGSSGRWIWWGHLVASASIKDIPTDLQ